MPSAPLSRTRPRWARLARPVRNLSYFRKVTVESSACVAKRQDSIRWTILRMRRPAERSGSIRRENS